MTTFFNKILAFIFTVLFAVAGVPASTVGYTDGTPLQGVRQDYCFDNSGIIIGGYYGTKGLAKYASEAGIDFIIESSVSEELLNEYQRYGVGIIAGNYNLPSYYGSVSESEAFPWLNIGFAKYKDHPALWGDDLIDEPDAASFGTLAKAVKSYREAKPDKIALVNLFPNYADSKQLGENEHLGFIGKAALLTNALSKPCNDIFRAYVSDYINTIDTDYISFDTYPYNSHTDSKGNEVKTTFEYYLNGLDILADACRSTGRDLWVITQAAGETKDGSDKPGAKRYCDEVSDISQQAYASLAFGAKAVIHGLFANKGWWETDSHMIGSDGQPTDTYYAVQTVNKDLKYFGDVYGNYKYTSTYVINKPKIAGMGAGMLMTTDVDEIIKIKSSNGLLIGTFTSENSDKAYIVTNMEELNNNITAKAEFKVPSDKTATLYQNGSTTVYSSGEVMKLTLGAGEGVFFTLNNK